MKRPWNIPDLPVYSIASVDKGKVNMNICTYVTAVSMKPKRYAVAIYHGTKTLQNVKASRVFILQLLHEDQYRLVNVLGKKSGKQYDKEQYLKKRDMLTDWKGWELLTDAVAWLWMEVISVQRAGDHDLFLCEVKAWKASGDGKVLTISELNKKGIVRI
jgi:hypothetical protein